MCPDDGECHVLAVETRKFQCTDSPYFSPDPRSARHLAVGRTTTCSIREATGYAELPLLTYLSDPWNAMLVFAFYFWPAGFV
jgi:hypothetical protein